MSLSGRIRKWWYWQQMAKIDRHCRKHGHRDSGCWAESGSIGVSCRHCGRILWTSWPGMRGDEKPRYQKPSRLVDSNWR
jgi:hypothetical protein